MYTSTQPLRTRLHRNHHQLLPPFFLSSPSPPPTHFRYALYVYLKPKKKLICPSNRFSHIITVRLFQIVQLLLCVSVYRYWCHLIKFLLFCCQYFFLFLYCFVCMYVWMCFFSHKYVVSLQRCANMSKFVCLFSFCLLLDVVFVVVLDVQMYEGIFFSHSHYHKRLYIPSPYVCPVVFWRFPSNVCLFTPCLLSSLCFYEDEESWWLWVRAGDGGGLALYSSIPIFTLIHAQKKEKHLASTHKARTIVEVGKPAPASAQRTYPLTCSSISHAILIMQVSEMRRKNCLFYSRLGN